jgi:hypothetical protein
MKKKINIIVVLIMISMSACFNKFDEGYDVVGPVATIPVFTISATQPTVGQNITVNFRYYSENIEVKQLRLIQTIAGTATTVSTKDISGFNKANSYEDSFNFIVPDRPLNTVINLKVEVITNNNLSNSRAGNITVK